MTGTSVVPWQIQLPTPTLLDRLVSAISPERGLRRLHARAVIGLFGSYKGARGDRRATQEWNPRAGSADADSIWDIPTLRARSRDLERNAPIATGALNTSVTSIVGTGLLLQPQVDAAYLKMSDEAASAWETAALRLWKAWADSRACDVTRRQTFDGLTCIVLRSTLVSGDILGVRRYVPRNGDPLGLRIQLIEADRLCNPYWTLDTDRLVGGVEYDGNGEPIRYHVLDSHPGDLYPQSASWTKLDTYGAESKERQVLHIFEQKRPGQSRGIPWLAPVIEPLKILDQYTDYELMAAAVSACFTVFVRTEGGGTEETEIGLSPAITDGTATTQQTTLPGQYRLAGGSIIDLQPGESIEQANPTRPNEKFDPFVQAILRQIGVALEIPFELLIKHYTASYSAARAAILEAWRAFTTRRNWLVQNWSQPCYEWVITEAVARGYLNAPGYFDDPLARIAYCGATWTGPSAGQINPLDEANAAEKRLAMGVSTLQQETAALTGGDWETNHQQQIKEARARREAGLAAPVPAPSAPTAAQRDAADAKPRAA